MELPLVLEVADVAVVVLEVFQGPITIGDGDPLFILFGFESPSSFRVETVSTGRVNLGH